MTDINVTPAEEANEHTQTKEIVDTEGNPIETKEEPKDDEGHTVESLQKALKDTKAELTKLQQAKTDEADEEPVPEDETENKETLETKATEAGVDFEALGNEYNTKGSLSEESYKDLESKGFPKQVVDDYIAGQVARNKQTTSELGNLVGGEENLPAILQWAGENLSPEEVQAYNEAVNSGSKSQAELALRGVYSRYTEAEGAPPSLVSGTKTNSTSGDVFKSPHAMTKAMEDPRYWKDPDYRAEVSEKVARSYKAGTI